MVAVTVAVNFKSSADSTGKYKTIVINVQDTTLAAVQTKAESLVNELHNIDNRQWSWSLPIVYKT